MRDEIHPAIKWFLLTVGVMTLLLGVAGGIFVSIGERAVYSVPPCRPELSREIGGGFRIRTGSPDSPVISFKAVRLSKRKMGPFSLAAFNILELDDLEIVFSPDAVEREKVNLDMKQLTAVFAPIEVERRKTKAEDSGKISSQDALVPKDGWAEIRRNLGIKEKISGLTIVRVSVAVQTGAEPECILRAERAEGRPDGALQLTKCFFVDANGLSHESPKGVLSLEDPVTLTAGGRQVILRDAARTFINRELNKNPTESSPFAGGISAVNKEN